jgi:hypothetical protein
MRANPNRQIFDSEISASEIFEDLAIKLNPYSAGRSAAINSRLADARQSVPATQIRVAE